MFVQTVTMVVRVGTVCNLRFITLILSRPDYLYTMEYPTPTTMRITDHKKSYLLGFRSAREQESVGMCRFLHVPYRTDSTGTYFFYHRPEVPPILN